MSKLYDTAIIGAGAAGITAAIYCARYKLKTIVISSEAGGTIVGAHMVENWPGIPEISGMELMEKFKEHMQKYDIESIGDEVIGIEKKQGEQGFEITTKDSKVFEAKTLILALGTKRRELNAKGEKEFLGKGVSYCATCDAPFYKNKKVAVIGGSDSACMAASLITKYADKVYLIYRKKQLRAQPIWRERTESNKKIEIIYQANITEIIGEKFVQKIKLDNNDELDVDGVFIQIGSVPNIALIKDLGIATEKSDHIIVDSEMKTNIKHVYAAGDVTNGKLKQVVTAAADGAKAALSAYNDLCEMEKGE